MSTKVAGRVQGGGCLVVRNQPQVWSVELTRFQGLNLVSYEVVTITDAERTTIIGAYLPPSNLEHLIDLELALTRFQEYDTIVVGDLSVNIGQYQKPRI